MSTKHALWIAQNERDIKILKQENEILKAQMDELKEIVHNTLMKHSPEYKKKIAMGSVDDFLRNRFGERTT